MKLTYGILVLLTVLLGIRADKVLAQVPPHAPGTICFTRQFWCWAQPPGPKGRVCYCPTPSGRVRGVLG